jgi:nucleoid DNA-binding protein
MRNKPSVYDNFHGKAEHGRHKNKKYKPLTWTNKHIARDIARSCDLPYEDAFNLLKVIINILQIELRTKHRLVLKKFGTLKVSKLKRPNNRAAYRIINFKCADVFNAYLDNKLRYAQFEYEIDQARKIRRLLLADEKMKALRYARVLNIRLETRPECMQYMIEHFIWPPSTWRKEDEFKFLPK